MRVAGVLELHAMRVVGVLAVALLLGVSGTASARPIFPSTVRTELALENDPPCTVCHTGTPMRATAKQPFARALLDHAEPAGRLPNASALVVSLRNMKADGTDTDGDGQGDTAELQAGRDPNTADDPDGGKPVVVARDAGTEDGGTEPEQVENPAGQRTSGCGIARVSGGPALLGFALALLLLLRRQP